MSSAPAPAGGWKRSFLRSAPGIGLVTVLLTLPFILLVPANRAWVVAFVVLCIYPVVEAPRNAGRPSWWLGAMVSFVVWVFVMGVLVQAADERARLRESSMVFIVPAMMFPLVLLVSGLVRLYRRARGLSREGGTRVATLLGGTLCGLMIGVPTALNVIPALIENRTGNTPPNTILTTPRNDVGHADAHQLTLQGAGYGPRTFLITPETRYGFLGSGKHPDDSKALDWLKPGQSISVEYVFRDHVAQARRVTVWVDRTGCAGDTRWNAMAPPAPDATLTGSRWEGRRAPPGQAEDLTTFLFLPGGNLRYGTSNDYTNPNGAWKQQGALVLIQVNDCYALYEARREGDGMAGEFSNERGWRQPWTAVRVAAAGGGAPTP